MLLTSWLVSATILFQPQCGDLFQPQCGGAVSVAFTVPKAQGLSPTEELGILLKFIDFFVPINMLYIMSYDITGTWYHIAYYIQCYIHPSHMLYNITVHIPTLHNTDTVIFKLLRYNTLYEWCYMWTRSLKYSIAIWHCFIATYIACYIYSHMAW